MTDLDKNNKSKKTRSKKRYENEGLVRVEVDLDYKTYFFLLNLVEKSGYQLDSDINKRQSPNTTRGKTGVITQAIVELYSKYLSKKPLDLDLDNKKQQAYIFKNRISAMKKLKISNTEILSTISKKIPNYIKINESLDILFNSKKNSSNAFPNIDKPKISDSIKKDLEKSKLTEFIS